MSNTIVHVKKDPVREPGFDETKVYVWPSLVYGISATAAGAAGEAEGRRGKLVGRLGAVMATAETEAEVLAALGVPSP